MLSVAVCEDIFGKRYLLQQLSQRIIALQVLFIRQSMMHMPVPVINVYLIPASLNQSTRDSF